ncbi:glycosyltransferase family 2 protein [Nonomuraea sp. NPDC050153]|uniref:glycosyltransferase family 2 protein n=1 Tax=Nonomuraea sp. NPDC050153 TaxID=3364359 RepID=UPI0037A6EDDA
MGRDLSIVIPFFNVAHYLQDCLNSIAGQTYADFEVIMVDDGSSDGSGKIAEECCRIDGRFKLLAQPNRGVGAARNSALSHVNGSYLAFVDGDDLVPERAFELLVASLEDTGSDIACGRVQRLSGGMLSDSPLHRGIFDEDARRTHIAVRPDLIGDRTAWNKVYRVSYWLEHDFTFPEHPFEDAPVTVPAHFFAGAVDLISEPVYYWRHRDEGPPSITQDLYNAKNLSGRMRQIAFVSEFLRQHSRTLKKTYDAAVLEHDAVILLSALPNVGSSLRAQVLDFVHGLLRDADRDVSGRMDPKIQEMYELVLRRDHEELIELLTARQVQSFYD